MLRQKLKKRRNRPYEIETQSSLLYIKSPLNLLIHVDTLWVTSRVKPDLISNKIKINLLYRGLDKGGFGKILLHTL